MSSQILIKPLPYIALLLAHLIWGGNFIVAKITLQEFPPSTLAFFRFALACLLIAPFFYAETRKVKIDRNDLPKLISIGILIITLNITFFFQGITKTTAIHASVLTLIIPMLSVLLGWLFLKEKIYLINLGGILLGLIGAVIIVGLPQIISGSFSSEVLIGNVLIIMAAISWVVGSVFSKEMLKKYPSLTVTGIAFLIGTITFIVPAVNEYIQNPGWPTKVTALGGMGLAYMTILSSISAYFLFEWGLAKTNVVTSNLFQYIEPFIASFLAILILSETLTIELFVGIILISIGVTLGTLAKEIHHRRKIHRH